MQNLTCVIIVMIIWWFDIQLHVPLQSVPITAKVVFESRSWRCVLETTLCDKVCHWLETDQWFSPGTPVSFTNKTDCHDITEILLKMSLNTITLKFYLILKCRYQEWDELNWNSMHYITSTLTSTDDLSFCALCTCLWNTPKHKT